MTVCCTALYYSVYSAQCVLRTSIRHVVRLYNLHSCTSHCVCVWVGLVCFFFSFLPRSLRVRNYEVFFLGQSSRHPSCSSSVSVALATNLFNSNYTCPSTDDIVMPLHSKLIRTLPIYLYAYRHDNDERTRKIRLLARGSFCWLAALHRL